MQLLRKIAVRTVFGDKAEILETVLSDKSKSHPLMRVVGVANGFKEGEGDYGAWKGLTGRFEATSAKTGEAFNSPVCFLPEFAIDLIAGQFRQPGDVVKFALDIGAIFAADAATSYEFTVTPLTETKDDELQELAFTANRVAPLALAAPEKPGKKDKSA